MSTFAGTVKAVKGRYGFVEVDETGESVLILPKNCHDWGGELPWAGTRVILQAEPNPTQGNCTMKATHVWQEPTSRDSKKYGQGWEEFSGKHAGYGKEKGKWQDWSQNDWKQESSQNDWSSYSTPKQKFHGTMDTDLGQYGFIMQDAENGGEPQKMFVLPYSCADMTLPPIGSRVEFTVVADPKTGRARAEDVVPEGGDNKTDQWNPLPGLPGEVYTGTFCKEKNTFGFIKPDQEFSEEVFVLPSACSGFFNNFPPLGTRVKFTLQPNKDKKSMMACEVTELDEGCTFSREMRKGIMEKNLGNYGFIRDGEEAIFVLPGSCKGKQIFEPGTRVVYRKVPCKKTGGVRAESVDVDLSMPYLPSLEPEAAASLEPADDTAYVAPDTSLTGVVVSTKESYGFIQVEDSETKVFLHISQCPGRTLPPVGAELQFDKTLGGGRVNATNVAILSTPEPPEPVVPDEVPDEGEQQGEEESMEDPPKSPEPELPRKARSYRSPEVAILWKRYCDENADGLYDPEEHSALFLREFLHAVLPGDLAAPAPKRQRTWDTKLTQVENKERQQLAAFQPFQLLFKAQLCPTSFASTKSWMKMNESYMQWWTCQAFSCASAQQLWGVDPGSMDLILCPFIFEHVAKPWMAIRTLLRFPMFQCFLAISIRHHHLHERWSPALHLTFTFRCLGGFCQDFGWHLASRWFCGLGCQEPRCHGVTFIPRPSSIRINNKTLLEGFPGFQPNSPTPVWVWLKITAKAPMFQRYHGSRTWHTKKPLYKVICEVIQWIYSWMLHLPCSRISVHGISMNFIQFHRFKPQPDFIYFNHNPSFLYPCI